MEQLVRFQSFSGVGRGGWSYFLEWAFWWQRKFWEDPFIWYGSSVWCRKGRIDDAAGSASIKLELNWILCSRVTIDKYKFLVRGPSTKMAFFFRPWFKNFGVRIGSVISPSWRRWTCSNLAHMSRERLSPRRVKICILLIGSIRYVSYWHQYTAFQWTEQDRF